VDLCIADRTFSKLRHLSEEILFGPVLKYLYSFFIYTDVDNINNFMNVRNIINDYQNNL